MKLMKVRINSNDISYGPRPAPGSEVEQHLTITEAGRVYFSAYVCGEECSYTKSRTKNFKISAESAEYLLSLIEKYASDGMTSFATDVGSWEMELTYEDGKTRHMNGALVTGLSSEQDNISDAIRENLDMPDLMVFDDAAEEDRIERIKIDYHRLSKLKIGSSSEDDTSNYVTWDYNENLTIDRNSQTIEFTQKISDECEVDHKYHVEGGVSNLLDGLDKKDCLSHIKGNPPDVVIDPLETKDYKITVDYLYGEQRKLTGTFDKNGLPVDFHEIMDTVLDFILFYGMGEMVDPSVHGKILRRKNELIFCNVKFEDQGKTYCYLTDDDTLEAGDMVVVHAGIDDHEAVAMIDSIEYHAPEEAPYPIEKIKRIIKRADDDVSASAQEDM